jgi:radical SAM superfamily enzyme YgiQ (UPF0313 family)
MKLLLIEPANRFTGLKNKFHVPPLALGVLAGLTPPDWEVEILLEPKDRIHFDREVDLVGITAATNNVKRGYEIADQFRARGKKVLMGGIHPTVMPEEALGHCDAVCIGEAESVFGTMLKDFERGTLQRIYRQSEYFDLSLYTPPRRDLMALHRSFFFDVGTVETSRGCPYDCDFCTVSSIHGRKLRHRPLDNLMPEIESINNRLIFFIDDNIVSNTQRAKDFCRELTPLRKRWAGQASISIARDRELMKLVSDSGCFGLIIGLESVIQEGFDSYSKSVKSLDELKESLAILKDNGIGVLATMVFGQDFDTRSTMKESLENLLELDITTASLGILVPYPGTRIAASMEQEGRILTRDWDYYDINNLVFKPRNFGCEEFLEDMYTLRDNFFSFGSICSRTLKYRGVSLWIALGVNMAMRKHNRKYSLMNPIFDEDETSAQAFAY